MKVTMPQPLHNFIIKLSDSIKKKFIKWYTKSRVFRNLSNSLGIGFGSSFIHVMGGACPCCGKGANTCAVGVGGAGLVGIFFGVLAFIFQTLKESYEWIRSKVKWKERKPTN